MDEVRLLHIEHVAKQIKRKYETTNPYELADFLGVIVSFAPYKKLLGFCTVLVGRKVIGLNSNAKSNTRRCACAHELGHIILGHLDDPGYKLAHYSDLTNFTGCFESEANCFAASLLVENSEAVEAIRQYGELARAAAALYVCPALIRSKMIMLNEFHGHHFIIPSTASLDPGASA